MKFKVGNKVKVKANSKAFHGEYAGKDGTITDIDRHWRYPYGVNFDDADNDSHHFHANELEKVKG